MDVYLTPAPAGCDQQFSLLLNEPFRRFIAKLFNQFKDRIEQLHAHRHQNLKAARDGEWLPANADKLAKRLDNAETWNWKVDPVPKALQDRRLDLGDVDPSNYKLFQQAMCADVQGLQVDLDDGFCPTWGNVLRAHLSVYLAVRNKLQNVPVIHKAPVLMFRPRAWNMTEHHATVNGSPVPGPLFDFAVHMFHNASILYAISRGPFFYLSKLEAASEAKLWDDIFTWTQTELDIPIGSIKACVLIEDIFAAFQMDEILFSLRRHSAGLNCGIWDYCASIISKFGHDPRFLLPDRNKYVNMNQPFLTKYMQLAVKVCRRRGTVATGGMAALMASSEESVTTVLRSKKKEIEEGVAGFMVYDTRLVPHMKKLWVEFNNKPISNLPDSTIYGHDLLQVPPGGVTKHGLFRNISVALIFINQWLQGHGHFIFQYLPSYQKSSAVKSSADSSVEDSATAEISRWQVYQWIIHKAKLENSEERVTLDLVARQVMSLRKSENYPEVVCAIYLRMLTLRQQPTFITTFLSNYFLLELEERFPTPRL